MKRKWRMAQGKQQNELQEREEYGDESESKAKKRREKEHKKII